jgi:hypothetical protein
MLCDEAPAAICGGIGRPEIGSANNAGSIPESGRTSVVAAEIHLGRSSATTEPAPQHSSCVPFGRRMNIEVIQALLVEFGTKVLVPTVQFKQPA